MQKEGNLSKRLSLACRPVMLDFISVGGYSYLTKSSLGIAFP
jgi:hypothetical protein